MLKYIELKTGYGSSGPAWIGRVQSSKSGKTLYFNGKAFQRGNMGHGNYFDIESRDVYWISGVKKNSEDRHWSGSGFIAIERSAVEEYLQITGQNEVDSRKLKIVDDFRSTDIEKFKELANEKL